MLLVGLTIDRKFEAIEGVCKGFEAVGYVCSRQIATTLYLAHHLQKPILVEGPAGVGKTELAKAAAAYLKRPLIRLQCYEGLDDSKALYEWKYGKQLLYTQILKDKLNDLIEGTDGLADAVARVHQYDDIFFSKRFLAPRPLLLALQHKEGAVLLVDEVDRSDQEFEAFLLEVLSDFQVSVPELGTIHAVSRPYVFLTSNNTREMSEALKRRCLHLYIPFPDAKLEREIVRVRAPDVPGRLRTQLVAFVQQLRELDLKKVPSVSETIDWARVLMILNARDLGADLIKDTLNILLKFEADIEAVEGRIYKMAEKAVAGH
jgi:MoxR-like ATPase